MLRCIKCWLARFKCWIGNIQRLELIAMEALIWGASGGIGQALVRLLKRDGWRVFAAARNERKIPGEADYHYGFDATVPRTMTGIPPLIAPESEGLDLMVYAAGMLRNGLLDRLGNDEWEAVFASNLTGAWLAAQASLPLMKTGGHILFIGAYVDHLLLPKMGAYAAAKAALEPLVRVLAKENRKQKFTLVRPGAVDTPFWEHAPFRKPDNAKNPMHVAEAILHHVRSDHDGELNL